MQKVARLTLDVICGRILVGTMLWEPRTMPDCTSGFSAILQTAATGSSTEQPWQTLVVRRASRSLYLMCTSCVTWPTTTWPLMTGTESSTSRHNSHIIYNSHITIVQFLILKSISVPVLFSIPVLSNVVFPVSLSKISFQFTAAIHVQFLHPPAFKMLRPYQIQLHVLD